MQRLQGDGWAFVHAGGTLLERTLAAGELIRVDTGCIVAIPALGQLRDRVRGQDQVRDVRRRRAVLRDACADLAACGCSRCRLSRLANRIIAAAPRVTRGGREEGSHPRRIGEHPGRGHIARGARLPCPLIPLVIPCRCFRVRSSARRLERSTSTCSISSRRAASIAAGASSMPGAETAGTWCISFAAALHCFGVDRDPAAIEAVRRLAAACAPALPPENFQVGEIERLPWKDLRANAVICSAVLHFASDEAHFGRMMDEMWRVLAPRRSVLRPARLQHRPGGPDSDALGAGSACPTDRIGSSSTNRCSWNGPGGWMPGLLDPIKTTNVQDQRCMTTWCLHKSSAE